MSFSMYTYVNARAWCVCVKKPWNGSCTCMWMWAYLSLFSYHRWYASVNFLQWTRYFLYICVWIVMLPYLYQSLSVANILYLYTSPKGGNKESIYIYICGKKSPRFNFDVHSWTGLVILHRSKPGPDQLISSLYRTYRLYTDHTLWQAFGESNAT